MTEPRTKTKPSAPRKPTRREAKELTRKRLVEATLEVLSEEGPEKLTTGRIARAAGLSQPSFYLYFSDMEDAQRAALREVGQQLRTVVREARSKVVMKPNAVRGAYAAAVTYFTAHPVFTKLLLRHRRDPTLLGRGLSEILSEAHEDFLTDLKALGAEKELRRLELYVDLVLGMTLTVSEAIIDGRTSDQEAAIDGLTEAAVGVYRAFMAPSELTKSRRKQD